MKRKINLIHLTAKPTKNEITDGSMRRKKMLTEDLEEEINFSYQENCFFLKNFSTECL